MVPANDGSDQYANKCSAAIDASSAISIKQPRRPPANAPSEGQKHWVLSPLLPPPPGANPPSHVRADNRAVRTIRKHASEYSPPLIPGFRDAIGREPRVCLAWRASWDV